MHSIALVFFALMLSAQGPVTRPSAFARMTVHAPKTELFLEVADTESEREYGLMNRTFLLRHHGMIFVFDRDGPVSFWMKNTLIPLDMVFVSAAGRVQSVASSVPASTQGTPDAKVARRAGFAKYVLELPAREAAADGLAAGASIPELRH